MAEPAIESPIATASPEPNFAGIGGTEIINGVSNRTPDQVLSAAANPADAESVVRAALALKDLILNERDPAKARALQNQLAGLVTDPNLDRLPGARGLVEGYVTEGANACAAADGQELANDAQDAAADLAAAGQSRRAGRLGSALRNCNICSSEELARINSIEDGNRTVATFDASGNVTGTREVRGEQLRESALIVRATAAGNGLDEEGRRALNMSLYGNENGPQNETERQNGERRLRQAVEDVEGENAARATSPEGRNAAGQRVAQSNAAIAQAQGMRQRRAGVPPGMAALADKMQADADQAVSAHLNHSMGVFSASDHAGHTATVSPEQRPFTLGTQPANPQQPFERQDNPAQPDAADLGVMSSPLAAGKLPASISGWVRA